MAGRFLWELRKADLKRLVRILARGLLESDKSRDGRRLPQF